MKLLNFLAYLYICSEVDSVKGQCAIVQSRQDMVKTLRIVTN